MPLFDIGLGRAAARFCIRISETETHEGLHAAEGSPMEAMLASAGASVLKHSPTRVIETGMGRVDATTPIPDPGGASRAGRYPPFLLLGIWPRDLRPHQVSLCPMPTPSAPNFTPEPTTRPGSRIGVRSTGPLFRLRVLKVGCTSPDVALGSPVRLQAGGIKREHR